MVHNHSHAKKHKHKRKINKKNMKAKKFVLEPSTPKKMMTDASPTHEAAALERALPITPSTPPAVEATTTVASKVKAMGSAVLKTMTPASRKSASAKGSPSPSPLRWVSYPIKRGDKVKAVLFSSKDSRTPKVIFTTPPNTKGAPNNTAVVGADVPSPAKPHVLAIELLATTTPSAADNVNMGSPPAPTSDDKKLADAAGQPEQITDSCKQTSDHGARATQNDVKAKRRGPAAALDVIRKAGATMASGGASLKQGITKTASRTWSSVKRAATCACFKTSATKA